MEQNSLGTNLPLTGQRHGVQLAGTRLLGALVVWLCWTGIAAGQDAPMVAPAPVLDEPHTATGLENAVLAGGCYWGTQGLFEHVIGVRQVVAGFSGGRENSDEASLISARTLGPAESIMITYDPAQISYGRLLQIFFSVAHDPTELNRQGPDEGSQYRSDVFYMNEEQKNVAVAYIAQLNKAHVFPTQIVTRVDPFIGFHRVGISQQDYLIKNPTSGYIVANDLPKIANLKRLYPKIYQADPITIAD